MLHHIILCRSLTAAQTGAKLLSNRGIYASVMRAPMGLTKRGCGYGIRVRSENVQAAERLLSAASVQTGGNYPLEGNNDISR